MKMPATRPRKKRMSPFPLLIPRANYAAAGGNVLSVGMVPDRAPAVPWMRESTAHALARDSPIFRDDGEIRPGPRLRSRGKIRDDHRGPRTQRLGDGPDPGTI